MIEQYDFVLIDNPVWIETPQFGIYVILVISFISPNSVFSLTSPQRNVECIKGYNVKEELKSAC